MNCRRNSGSTPQQHLYEEVCYVLAGNGSTEFEAPDGHTQVIEWGPKSLFALPMNARYRHRNTSAEPARFAAISDLRYLFNLYRSEKFVFEMPLRFAERHGGIEAVADLAKQAAGPLTLAKGTISSDVNELAPGTYREAKRQMFGAHLLGVDGEGYMLTWEEGSQDYARTDWRHGIVTAAPGHALLPAVQRRRRAGALPRFADGQPELSELPLPSGGLWRHPRLCRRQRHNSLRRAGSAHSHRSGWKPLQAKGVDAEDARVRLVLPLRPIRHRAREHIGRPAACYPPRKGYARTWILSTNTPPKPTARNSPASSGARTISS